MTSWDLHFSTRSETTLQDLGWETIKERHDFLMDTIVSAPYVTLLVLSQDSETEPVGRPWEPAAEGWGLLQ